MAIVVGAEAFKETKDPAAILRCSIRKLVSCPAIKTRANHHILVEIERRDDSLREDVHDVIVRVSAAVKLCAECRLPFLRLQNAMRIGRMQEKTFETQLAHATDFRTRL